MNQLSKLVILIMLVMAIMATGFSWWNQSWEYRKPINVTEESGKELSNYQIKLTVDTSSLITEGNMQSDCSDVRIVSNKEVKLDYWIESGCDTSSTEIWAEVPEINSSSKEKIYLYYGNSDSDSESKAEDTFLIYDDFSDGSIGNQWSSGKDDFSNYPSETSGSIKISGTGSGGQYWYSSSWIQSSEPIGNASDGFVATVDSYAENNGARDQSYLMFYNDNTHAAAMTSSTEGSTHEAFTWEGGSVSVLHGRDGETWFSGDMGSYSPQTFEPIKLKWDAQSNTFYFYDDSGNVVSRSVSWESRKFFLRLSSYARTSNGITGKFDNLRVRKYSSPEPSVSIGAEEKGSICDTRGPRNECIVDSEKNISSESFSITNWFVTETTSIFRALTQANLKISNTSKISGTWKGTFNLTSEKVSVTPGAKFRPENGDIILGSN